MKRLAVFVLLLSGCGRLKRETLTPPHQINITVTFREAPNGQDIATQSCYGMSQCVMTLDGHEILVTVSP